MEGVREQQARIDRGELHLTTSVVTLTEVLEGKQKPEAHERFQQLFQRRNVDFYEVNTRIARLAHDIRDYYRQRDHRERTLSTPDALHLATAIRVEDCNVMYTFDRKNKGDKLALLPLENPIAGRYRIAIQKPHAELPPTLNL